MADSLSSISLGEERGLLPVLALVGWRYRRQRRQGAAISCLLAGLTVLLSCGLGAVGLAQDRHLDHRVMTTFVGILITGWLWEAACSS